MTQDLMLKLKKRKNNKAPVFNWGLRTRDKGVKFAFIIKCFKIIISTD